MTYDYVIVGAGSAGCVLANRLSANPNSRVLLLEAGPRDWHPFIHMPAGLAKLVGKKGINWDYYTETEDNLDKRRLWWPRGRVLGGSSSINAMCYIRGVDDDYDQWARAAGDERWNWQNVLPYFKRAEGNTRGADELHGNAGPLGVQDLSYHNPLSQAFVDAAVANGHPANRDFNGVQQEGFGLYQVTQRNGARCSAATGYLRSARAPGEPACAHRRSGPARADERRTRDRRRLSPSWPPDPRRGPRGDPVRRRDQFAAAVAVVRDRSGRPSSRERHSRRAGLARRRREPAGSPGHLHATALHPAGHL
jgi:choline dehydrogenase-like flavoprotein